MNDKQKKYVKQSLTQLKEAVVDLQNLLIKDPAGNDLADIIDDDIIPNVKSAYDMLDNMEIEDS